MRRGVARAAAIGATWAVAVIVLLAIAAGVLLFIQRSHQPLKRLMVIVVAPGKDSGEVAPIAFVLQSPSGSIRALDTRRRTTILGSSAQNAADAYTFGGGGAVAAALSGQTGNQTMDWVALPSPLWADMIDAAGGVIVQVPEDFSAYSDGELTVVQAGNRKLTGREAVGLISSADYFTDIAVRQATVRSLEKAIARIVSRGDTLQLAVSSGNAASSVEADRIPDFGSK